MSITYFVSALLLFKILNNFISSSSSLVFVCECVLRREANARSTSGLCSKVIQFLIVMMKHGFIGEFEIIDDHRAGKMTVNLTGKLNKCEEISPRFDVQLKDLEKWQNIYAPIMPVWFHCTNNLMDPWRSKTKTYRRENPGILFLAI
jgi:small subunit ribosomal protein S15Ae